MKKEKPIRWILVLLIALTIFTAIMLALFTKHTNNIIYPILAVTSSILIGYFTKELTDRL